MHGKHIAEVDEAAEADKAAEEGEADEAVSGSKTMTELRRSPKKHASSAVNADADGDNDDATSRARTRRGAASSSGAASSGGAPIAEDQEEEEADEHAGAVCNVCNKGDNDAALLLCDSPPRTSDERP